MSHAAPGAAPHARPNASPHPDIGYLVQGALEEGYRYFDSAQLGDAKRRFSQALELDAHNIEARQALNLVTQAIVPRWHFAMMNDHERNDRYDEAIRRVVDASTVVLDVGSGSGLLAMMAARAGAKRIYTCELNETVAEMAKVIVAENGYADRIKVIARKSDQLVIGEDMAEKADVLITETLDSGLLGEGVVPIVLDAKARLLVDDAPIIPRDATLYAALVETREVWELNYVETASGFDVRSFNQLSTAGAYPIRLQRFEHRFLSEITEMCRIDFMRDELGARQFEVPLSVTADGVCHAVAYWYDLDLDEHASFKNSPENDDSHWKQAIRCFHAPVEVRAGRPCSLSVTQSLTDFDFALQHDG